MIEPSRYAGNPLLRLLEWYVLRAIGELSVEDEAKVVDITPNLQRAYSRPGQWFEILASIIHMPADTDARIREMWTRNRAIAAQTKQTLTPQKFAEMFVDKNLVGQ